MSENGNEENTWLIDGKLVKLAMNVNSYYIHVFDTIGKSILLLGDNDMQMFKGYKQNFGEINNLYLIQDRI